MAERASTKQNARQITIIFFIADILLLSTLRPLGRRLRRVFSGGYPAGDKIAAEGNPGHRNASGITHPRPNVIRGESTIPQGNLGVVRGKCCGDRNF
jgi:hypothetical protein